MGAKNANVQPAVWSLEELKQAPFRGMRYARWLREDGEHLSLSSHWFLGAASIVGPLMPVVVCGIFFSRYWLPAGAELPGYAYALLGGAMIGGFIVQQLANRYGQFEINLPKGWGRISLGVLLGNRSFEFPVSAVRQVVLVRRVPGGRRLKSTVRLRLADAEGRGGELSVCTCRPRQARRWARTLAEWLRIGHTEVDFESLRRTEVIGVPPARVAGGASSPPREVRVPDTRASRRLSRYMQPKVRLDAGKNRLQITTAAGAAFLATVCGVTGLLIISLGAVGAASVASADAAHPYWPMAMLIPAMGIGFLAAAAIAWFGRQELDAVRHMRHLRYLRPWRGWVSCTFDHIAAVQSLNFSRQRDAWNPFELNLVLASGERVCLVAGAKREFADDTGRRLATFLGVPWIDHLEGPGWEPPATPVSLPVPQQPGDRRD